MKVRRIKLMEAVEKYGCEDTDVSRERLPHIGCVIVVAPLERHLTHASISWEAPGEALRERSQALNSRGDNWDASGPQSQALTWCWT